MTLEELSACYRGCRFGLVGCGGLCWLRRGLLGLGLLGLINFLLDSADLHAAFQDCSILYADPVGYHIARQRALAANIQAIRTLDVTLHLADDHNFAGTDVGGDVTVTPNGDAVTGKINGALDSAIDVQRLGTAASPLMTSERPIVACSTGTLTVLTGVAFGFEENCDF